MAPKNMGLDEAEVDRRVHEAMTLWLDPTLERSPRNCPAVRSAGWRAASPVREAPHPCAGRATPPVLTRRTGRYPFASVKEYFTQKDRHHRAAGVPQHGGYCQHANRVLVMSNKKIAMYDTVEKVFARAPELLELGLSVPQVTKILQAAGDGVDVPADAHHSLRGQDPAGSRAAAMRGKSCAAAALPEGVLSDAARYPIGQHFPGNSLVHRFDPD